MKVFEVARVVMTSSQICTEVEAQVKRLTVIRRSLFECKGEEEDMLQGGLRVICGNDMNLSQTTKGTVDTGADECDSVGSFRPLSSVNAYSFTSPLLPSWVPITITARDVLEVSNNAIRLNHRLVVPRSRDLKSLPFSGRIQEGTIGEMKEIEWTAKGDTTGFQDGRVTLSDSLKDPFLWLVESTGSDPPVSKTASSKRQDIGTTSSAQKLLVSHCPHMRNLDERLHRQLQQAGSQSF